ncbi:MAG: ABC transporter ATP-binding protein [Phascolarctobacterium sp.]
MKNDEVILEINHLTKEFPLASGETLTACNDINLRVYQGKTLGIIGESGCGKSTLVRTLLRIHPATSGEVIFEGKNLLNLSREELRKSRKKMQLVFQDPNTAFNPKMLVKNIITEPLLNFGLIKQEDVDAKAIELLNLVELPPTFKDKYPHNMSGGQRQRLGIARALSLDPQIVICDEATSALDVSVQKSICELLCKIQKAKNITYIFIAHDLGLVDLMCQQVAVMYLGYVVEIIENGRISTICKHPYTKLLMQSVFDIYKKIL